MVNTSIRLNDLNNETFSEKDKIVSIGVDEYGYKVLSDAVYYESVGWEPFDATLEFGIGYVLKIKNGFDFNFTGTLGTFTKINIPNDTQVTFAITNTFLNLTELQKSVNFENSDAFVSIGVKANGEKQLTRHIFNSESNTWNNPILEIGKGYVSKIGNGINKIII